MKPKSFALAALLVAILGIGISWFMRPTMVSTGKTVEAPIPAKTNAPKLDTSVPQVEPPKLPPAPAGAKTTELAPSVVDPRANLGTAIAEASRVLDTGDLRVFFNEFIGPAGLNGVSTNNNPNGRVDYLVQLFEQDSQFIGELKQFQMELRSIQDQGLKPTISDDGNWATYADTESLLTLRKQDGLWYVFKM